MTKMTAVRIHEFGGADVLRLDEVSRPEPKAGELLVKIEAASVNPVDIKIRSGKFPGVKSAQLPVTLGRDLCGSVEARGSASETFEIGDCIYAMVDWDRGTYADYAIVRTTEAAHKPENIDYTRAAATPLAAITAWQGLFDQGGLQKEQCVLIHGGAGGVGHFAIQLAKAKGAFVIATVSGKDVAFARKLGADSVIDYKSERFEDSARNVDLVYDLIGGETQARSFHVLREGGTLVSTVAEPHKERAAAHRIRALRYMATPNGAQLAEIAALIDGGKVMPSVQRVFALRNAAEAHDVLERGHVQGKIVLETGHASRTRTATSGASALV
jgi:NADPH:quinone reductase-like Zn-dependent oxidoreductase